MQRVIKKYPNRRLYDTAESRYVTLDDVRELVVSEVPFVVIDKKSNEDITRSILLQVINDQEQQREPILSEAFLAHLIRAYDKASPDFLARHLEQSLTSFIAQKNHIVGQLSQSVAPEISPQVPARQKKVG